MTRSTLLASVIALSVFGPVLGFAQEQHPFPDGCGNPFFSDGSFGDFYEKTIQTAVIDNGAVSEAHVRLFAVNKLRKYVSEKYPNPADGEVVDKHIRAQLCLYGKENKFLNSSSAELHKHLQSISGRLLTDTRRIVSELGAKEQERQKSMARFEARYGLIERAERLGEKEVANLTK